MVKKRRTTAGKVIRNSESKHCQACGGINDEKDLIPISAFFNSLNPHIIVVCPQCVNSKKVKKLQNEPHTEAVAKA